MSGSNLYQENNFQPCLTKQLSNVFKLWCECGISLFYRGYVVSWFFSIHLTVDLFFIKRAHVRQIDVPLHFFTLLFEPNSSSSLRKLLS